MTTPLIVEYYQKLPQRNPEDHPLEWRIRRQAANEGFRKRVAARYTEGTLLRLLESADPLARRAATLALGMVGSAGVNPALAARLHDGDTEVWQLAAEALWALWLRGGNEGSNQELQRLLRLRNIDRALEGLDQLIQKAPSFAEAYNQRAILAFRQKRYAQAIQDCETVLRLNPYHFGALSGMGQAYLYLRRHRAALRAFRNALRIHPHLDGIAETVRSLEKKLGGEGRRDDKKT